MYKISFPCLGRIAPPVFIRLARVTYSRDVRDVHFVVVAVALQRRILRLGRLGDVPMGEIPTSTCFSKRKRAHLR